MMGFNIQTEVMLVSLPKKFPSREGQLVRLGPKLSNLMFHDSLSENFFEILWHDGAQYIDKIIISQSFKKNLLFWRFLEAFQHNGVQQLDISNISQFFRKISFLGKGKLGQKLYKIILTICSLRGFLKLCSMMGYKRPKQCWSTFPKNSLWWKGQLRPNLAQNYL